eukprot:5791147-Heterocapsa_arctica.AAC.1
MVIRHMPKTRGEDVRVVVAEVVVVGVVHPLVEVEVVVEVIERDRDDNLQEREERRDSEAGTT